MANSPDVISIVEYGKSQTWGGPRALVTKTRFSLVTLAARLHEAPLKSVADY